VRRPVGIKQPMPMYASIVTALLDTRTRLRVRAARGLDDGAARSRSRAAAPSLATDDWGGYLKYDTTLRARQLCCAHLIRSLRGVADEGGQAWATAMIEALRAGRRTVKTAVAAGRDALDAEQIASLRERYTELANEGSALNRARRKADGGRHPGWVLARRLLDKTDQVLHHLRDFAVPWTSNLAEQAPREGPPEDLRVLQDPGHHQGPLPHPLLPTHHQAARHRADAGHPRRTHRPRLDTTPTCHSTLTP